MRNNNIMNQISSIFGAFMTVFYIGVGFYLAFASMLSYFDPFLRKFIGFTFVVYGLYRGYMTFVKIKRSFFGKDEDFDE